MNTYFAVLYKWWLYSYFLIFWLYIHISYLILKHITFLWEGMELLWFVSSINGVNRSLQVMGWWLKPADTQDTSYRRNFELVSGLRSWVRSIYIARFLKAPSSFSSSATQSPHIYSFFHVFRYFVIALGLELRSWLRRGSHSTSELLWLVFTFEWGQQYHSDSHGVIRYMWCYLSSNQPKNCPNHSYFFYVP